MKIAMWSGPRNLSTALMYAFGNRPDFAIWDEPFYAPYLAQTGALHPMRDDILSAHETDPVKVADRCRGPIPDGKPHFYMKHMPHHMLEDFPLDWVEDCVNVHLIRHPARVIASYVAKREDPTLEDIGYVQQARLFDRIGGLVIDSRDIRADPQTALTTLCNALGLPFDDAMLRWPKGPRDEDGVWAAHWYGAVHESTGFAGAEEALPDLSGDAARLRDAAMPYFETLAAHALAV